MRKYGRSVHFAGAAFFLFIFLEYRNESTPFELGPLGKWKYFPQWNLVFQLCYFVLASLMDIIALIRGQESKTLLTIRDTFFASFAFPYGVFVATSFWGIYSIDRELIFPKLLDAIIPNWINHALHTWCAVAAILEAAINCHDYPRNRVGITLMLSFGVVYISWLFYIANTMNYWVYPFLRVMETYARLSFFTVCATILALFYMIGKWMTVAIWGGAATSSEIVQEKKTANKKKVKKVE
ncbi:androgen-induced gene 1 protein isoform X3 [Exaiptasia diaphana]|uniref:Androgen-induced gene 1 protein-like n=1 Tax=Exaiptasia diaphana TaxID=2652724 RepID=A0A913XA02_EXADI|nr:androgen-induced gene 1 protein isoform X3 [Exaiptasia diaphana]